MEVSLPQKLPPPAPWPHRIAQGAQSPCRSLVPQVPDGFLAFSRQNGCYFLQTGTILPFSFPDWLLRAL